MWDEDTILNIIQLALQYKHMIIIPYDQPNNVLKTKQNKAMNWLIFTIVGYVSYTIKH